MIDLKNLKTKEDKRGYISYAHTAVGLLFLAGVVAAFIFYGIFLEALWT